MSSTLTNLTAATTWSGTDLFYALIGGNSRKIAAAKFLVAETSSSLAMQDSTTAQTFRVYGTFTDSSNYHRLALQMHSSGDGVELAAETAGMGTDDLNVYLTPAGAGSVKVQGGVAPPAGGATTSRIRLSSTVAFGLYWGSGAPTVSGAKGSLYLRTDGTGTADRIYVCNATGGGAGTWTAITTAS